MKPYLLLQIDLTLIVDFVYTYDLEQADTFRQQWEVEQQFVGNLDGKLGL